MSKKISFTEEDRKKHRNATQRSRLTKELPEKRSARLSRMKVYHKTKPNKPMTDAQKKERNRKRRELYAIDAVAKKRARESSSQWQKEHPERRREQRLRKFGMTLLDFQALIQKQEGKCAICGYSDLTDSKFFPHVDHDHATGRMRGLLCSSCNFGLGKFHDNPDLLLAAARYLVEQS
jgi:hypothetical protein